MVEAELHDGTILEFPDGTAPDVVQRTVKKHLGIAEQPSLMSRAGAALKPAEREPMPSTADTINAGWTSPAEETLSVPGSVMDGYTPRENGQGMPVEAGMGPMRKDYYDQTRAGVLSAPVEKHAAAAKAGGQVGKIAAESLPARVVANERAAAGDTQARTMQELGDQTNASLTAQPLRSEAAKEANRQWLTENSAGAIEGIKHFTKLDQADAEAELQQMIRYGVKPSWVDSSTPDATLMQAASANIGATGPALQKALLGLSEAAADQPMLQLPWMDYAKRTPRQLEMTVTNLDKQIRAARNVGGKIESGSWNDVVSTMGPSLATNMPPLIAAALVAAKNPAAGMAIANGGLGVMGMQKFGDNYLKGQMKGLSAADNLTQASLGAAAEVIPEKLSLNSLFAAFKTLGKGSAIDAVKAFAKQQLTEHSTEQITTIADHLIDKAYTEPNKSLESLWSEMKQTAMATAIQAPLLAAGGAAAHITGQAVVGAKQRFDENRDITAGMQFDPGQIDAAARQSLDPANAQMRQVGARPAPVPPQASTRAELAAVLSGNQPVAEILAAQAPAAAPQPTPQAPLQPAAFGWPDIKTPAVATLPDGQIITGQIAGIQDSDGQPMARFVGADGQVWMIQPGEADIKPAPAVPDVAAKRQRKSAFVSSQQFSVDTEDNGKFDVTVHRTASGDVVVNHPDGLMEYKAAFANGKTDAELLAYGFEPVGFRNATTAPAGDGTRTAPVQAETAEHVKIAEQQVDTNPTEAMKDAGNYKLGHLAIQGLDIAIENPAGSVRSGVDKAGKPWSNTLNHTYGYIKGATAADGDKLDVFIGPDPQSQQVFVIDQIDPDTGKYDEGKVILGASSIDEARNIYLSNYDAGWQGLGDITPMVMPAFKAWIAKGATHKPLAYDQKAAIAERKAAADTQKAGEAYAAEREKAVAAIGENQVAAIEDQVADQNAGQPTSELYRAITAALKAEAARQATKPAAQPAQTPSVPSAQPEPVAAAAPIAAPQPAAVAPTVEWAVNKKAKSETLAYINGELMGGVFHTRSPGTSDWGWKGMESRELHFTQEKAMSVEREAVLKRYERVLRNRALDAATPTATPTSTPPATPMQLKMRKLAEAKKAKREAAKQGEVNAAQAPEAQQSQSPAPQQGAAEVAQLPAVREQLSVEFGGQRYPVESLQDASEKWEQFRDQTGAGVSDIGNGVPIFDQTGKQIAYVSYNGKVWQGAEYRPNAEPIYVPKDQNVPKTNPTPAPTLPELRPVVEAPRTAAAKPAPDAAPVPNAAAQDQGADRGAVAEERAYTKGQAEVLARRMTNQGLPSEAYPHPTQAGMWAIRVPGEQDAAPVEVARMEQPQHIEAGQAEPATAPVIAASIKESAKNTPMNIEQAREWLLKQIDAALIDAKSAAEEDVWDRAEGKVDLKGRMDVKETIGYKVFDVPGDGRFSVLNLKESLQKFKKQVAATPGFKKNATRPMSVANGSGGKTSVRDMLEDGEYVLAVDYGRQIGEPLLFGAVRKGEAHPIAYTNAEPVDIKGIEAQVGREWNVTGKSFSWRVIETTTGVSVSSETTKERAVSKAKAYVDEHGADKLVAQIKETPKVSQSELERQFTDWGSEEEAKAQKTRDAVERADTEDRALWNSIFPLKDGEKRSPNPWNDIDHMQVVILAKDAAKAGKGDEFVSLIERRRGGTNNMLALAARKALADGAPKAKPAKGSIATGVASKILGDIYQRAAYNKWTWDRLKSYLTREMEEAGVGKSRMANALEKAMTEYARTANGRLGYPNSNLVFSAMRDYGLIAEEDAAQAKAEQSKGYPFYSNNKLFNAEGTAELPKDWTGVARSDSGKRFFYLGQENGERSFNPLKAESYEDALKEAEGLKNDKPVIPDGYREVARGYFGGTVEKPIYAPFAEGERVRFIGGHAGNIQSFIGGPVTTGAIIKYDNGLTGRAEWRDVEAVKKPAAAQEPKNFKSIDALNAANNPLGEDDWIRFADGSEWQVKGRMNGWVLMQGKTEHPTVKNIMGQVPLIRAVIEANDAAQPKPNPIADAADAMIKAAEAMKAAVQGESKPKEDVGDVQVQNRIRTYWMDNVVPPLRDYFAAYRAMGADRMERNGIKPEGMSATDWLMSFSRRESTWSNGRKTGETGIQYLSHKDLWPTGDDKGESLRKAMLASIKVLKASPGSNGDWIESAEQGNYDVWDKPKAAVAQQAAPEAGKPKTDVPLIEHKVSKATREMRETGAQAFSDGEQRAAPGFMSPNGQAEWLNGWDAAKVASEGGKQVATKEPAQGAEKVGATQAPVLGTKMDWREFGNYLSGVSASDAFGNVDAKEKREWAAAGESWQLLAVDPKTLDTVPGETPDTSSPIIVSHGDVLDGRSRRAEATANKAKAIAAWVASDEKVGAGDVETTFNSLEDDQRSAVSRAIDRAIAIEQGKDVKPLQVIRVRNRIGKLRADLEAGKISEALFISQVESLHAQMEIAAESRKYEPTNGRARGADFLRQKLLEAKRRGDISEQAADMAEWFILKNPALVDDLGIGIRTPKEGQNASGNYNPLNRVMTLFKESASDTTAVHEILHHLERMMPAEMQAEIRKEWLRAVTGELQKAQKAKDQKRIAYFEAVLVGNMARATKLLTGEMGWFNAVEPAPTFKAPNGKPSKLNLQQWKQVRTPEFKAWFGDWEKHAKAENPVGSLWSDPNVSKVVDENGEPLVVYHGTQQGGFDIFKPEKGDKHRSPMVFATDDPGTARSYSGRPGEIEVQDQQALDRWEELRSAAAYNEKKLTNAERAELRKLDDLFNHEGGGEAESQRGIYHLFLNIRDPNESDFEGANWDGQIPPDMVEIWDTEQETNVYTDDGRAFMSAQEAESVTKALDYADRYVVRKAQDRGETTNSVAEEAKRFKQDGAIIRNVTDDGGKHGYGVDTATVFVLFDSNQFKSATQNDGKYSTKNDSILHDLAIGQDYQYLNPSEFWAVRMTNTAAARFEAKSIWARSLQWLKEALEHLKGALGLKSDHPLLKALDDLVARGTGEFVSGEMLGSSEVYASIEESGPEEVAGVVMRDVSLAARLLLHPRQIAANHKPFVPVFDTAIKQFEERDRIVSGLGEMAKPYFELTHAQRLNVNKIVEQGRLDRTVYTVADLENGIHHAESGDLVVLNAEEIGAYKSLRRTFNEALSLFRDTMLEEFGFAELIPEQKAAAKLRQMIADGEIEESRIEWARHVAKAIDEIEQAKRTGYAPFNRYGQFVVAVKALPAGVEVQDDDGKQFVTGIPEYGDDPLTQIVTDMGGQYDVFRDGWVIDDTRKAVLRALETTLFATKVEVNAFNEWRKQGKDVTAIPEVKAAFDEAKRKYGKAPNARVLAFHITEKAKADDANLSTFDELARISDVDVETWDAVREKLQEAIKAKSFRKHFFGSDNTPGYSVDFERSVADYIIGMSGYLARRKHVKDFDNAIKHIKAPALAKYAEDYRKYVNSPADEFALLKNIGFLYYIAGSTATAVANLTQVPMLTMPTLVQFVPHHIAAREVARAWGETLAMFSPTKTGLQMFDPAKVPADVRDVFKAAWEDQLFVPLETLDLMAASSIKTVGGRRTMRALSVTTQAIAYMFMFAERLNRITTFIAAARISRMKVAKDRMRDVVKNDAWARHSIGGRAWGERSFAEWAVDESQYRMGKVNRPTVMRGVGSPLLQFKGYMIQTLEAGYRMAVMHGKGGKPAALAALAMMLMLGGIWGLPGLEDLREMIERLYKVNTGKDLDLKTEVRQLIARTTGSASLAAATNKGIPYATVGVDMSRVGMGNILPDSALQVGGIPVDLAIARPMRAAEKMAAGKTTEAMSEFLPNFLKNPAMGLQWKRDGLRDKYGSRMMTPGEFDYGDVAIKSLGWTPTKVTNRREYTYAESRAERGIDELKRRYTNDLVRAYVHEAEAKDPAEKAEYKADQAKILAKIEEHNKTASPENLIKLDPGTLRRKAAAEFSGSAAREGKERKLSRGAAQDRRELFQLGR